MPPTAVEVRLDKSSYPSRADVKLTLVNNARRTLGYNACTRQVERESGGGWTVVPEPDRVCTMELRILDANETVTEQTDLPQLQPGRYRIALNFSDEASGSGGPIRATSSPFDVR